MLSISELMSLEASETWDRRLTIVGINKHTVDLIRRNVGRQREERERERERRAKGLNQKQG